MRVLLIGAGVGGLCLAHGLRKAGLEVTVFEKQKTVSENLAGYGIHIDANGKRALQRCLPAKNWTRFMNASIPAGTQMFFRDTNLQILAERDDAKITGMPINQLERRGIGRIELRDILLDGLNDSEQATVVWGKTFTHYTELPQSRVRVHFSDGTHEDGDVLVGADGARSAVRQQRLPQIERVDLGIYAIAGRCALSSVPKILHQDLANGSLNNIVPHGKGWMFVSAWRLPSNVVSRDITETEHHIIWAYVMPQDEFSSAVRSMNSVTLMNLVLRGIQTWSPSLKTLVQKSSLSTITCIPLRTMPVLEPWTPSNITVLGDAIHNMTPMAGAGANTALRDAELLTQVLTEVASERINIIDAIGVYEDSMRLYANEAVKLSRRNAESASSGNVMQRLMFRLLLQAAQASSFVMRATIGKAILKSH